MANIVRAEQPFDHSPTFKWTLVAGDHAAILPLPLGGRVLVQVDGDLAGGEVVIDAGLLEQHLATVKVFQSEGISAIPPVRYVLPRYDGAPVGASVTVIIAVAP